jgi:Na+-translocating ferredoxin:NAD+ oxidoreductase RnfG subunit
MNWKPVAAGLLMAGSAAPLVAHATVYLTVAQAQQKMFAGAAMQRVVVGMTDDQIKALKKATGIYHPFKADQVYKVAGGGWFVVDQVLGKHEMITYAVALNADGSVKQVEVLEYRETYGGDVRNASWLGQFVGKTAADPFKLNGDVKNISGATVSSRHLTDGVKRIVLVRQWFAHL